MSLRKSPPQSPISIDRKHNGTAVVYAPTHLASVLHGSTVFQQESKHLRDHGINVTFTSAFEMVSSVIDGNVPLLDQERGGIEGLLLQCPSEPAAEEVAAQVAARLRTTLNVNCLIIHKPVKLEGVAQGGDGQEHGQAVDGDAPLPASDGEKATGGGAGAGGGKRQGGESKKETSGGDEPGDADKDSADEDSRGGAGRHPGGDNGTPDGKGSALEPGSHTFGINLKSEETKEAIAQFDLEARLDNLKDRKLPDDQHETTFGVSLKSNVVEGYKVVASVVQLGAPVAHPGVNIQLLSAAGEKVSVTEPTDATKSVGTSAGMAGSVDTSVSNPSSTRTSEVAPYTTRGSAQQQDKEWLLSGRIASPVEGPDGDLFRDGQVKVELVGTLRVVGGHVQPGRYNDISLRGDVLVLLERDFGEHKEIVALLGRTFIQKAFEGPRSEVDTVLTLGKDGQVHHVSGPTIPLDATVAKSTYVGAGVGQRRQASDESSNAPESPSKGAQLAARLGEKVDSMKDKGSAAVSKIRATVDEASDDVKKSVVPGEKAETRASGANQPIFLPTNIDATMYNAEGTQLSEQEKKDLAPSFDSAMEGVTFFAGGPEDKEKLKIG